MIAPAVVGVAVGAAAVVAAGTGGWGRRGRSSDPVGHRRSAGRNAPEPARWARRRDLAPLLIGPGRSLPVGRLVAGRLGRALVATEPSQSMVVFGPSQSGKTSGLAVPAILEWQGPVVAASVKTDLFDDTVHWRSTRGPVHCYDPSGVTGRGDVDWSPVGAAATWPDAKRVASTLCEVGRTGSAAMADGDFWYATAARYLAPLLFAAATGRRDMAEVIRWTETGEEDEILDLLEGTGVGPAMDAARSAFSKEERQRSSTVTTLETVLEPFSAAAPRAPWEAPLAAVDPVQLLANSGTLHLCAPAHDQRRLTPLFVGLLRSVLDHAYDRVARTGRPLDPPLLVVLDEAANIAPVPDLDALAATAAGHGIQLVTIWHDLAQLNARYGVRAATVVNNHRAQLFLSGISDPSTLDHASHLIGDTALELPSTTTGSRSAPSTTRTTERRRLAPPEMLRRLSPGSGVLLYRDLPPARLALRSWFDDPTLVGRARPEGGQ